ncbi:MAG: phytoene desaturase [Polyangiaceae bacterium]|nr:phytoene desaturase [Polyangiaceae bacterium]
MARTKVVVVGAGPGGLTAAMILARHGCEVTVLEKEPRVGGRNAAIVAGDYRFDLGPTFLMMKGVLEEVFDLAGRRVEDYLDIVSLDPLYRLVYADGREFLPTRDRNAMREQIARLFPGNTAGYDRYLAYEAKKLTHLIPCLQLPYSSPAHLLRPALARALPYLDAHKSLHRHLAGYFDAEDLRLAFTFQAKYLGMSPWHCPATFSMISFMEHSEGVHHPIGGLNKISEAMGKIVEEHGGTIRLGTPVDQVLVQRGAARGVRLASGEEVHADYTVLNADFGYAMQHLLPPGTVKKWAPDKLAKKGFSCSTFMVYLGVDRRYDGLPHHNILFARDYKSNVADIAERMVLSADPSVYVQNASVTDPTLAPEGHSTIYLLVPVANNRSDVDWEREQDRYRDQAIRIAEERGGFTDLSKHIVVERRITPQQFEREVNVYAGAVFNLAHSMDQMLLFRPHNAFEEVGSLYLVGGGTHPGSGLPTIYESGRISAGLILKRGAWFN